MNKPDGIPQDVWDTAQGITDTNEPSTETLARAIMAERERWQAVIQTMDELAVTEKTCFDLVVRERKQMAEDIAAAIRGCGQPTCALKAS